MRSVRVFAAVSAVLCAAAPIARADAPHATVSGSGIALPALLSSGEQYCPAGALFADAGWPPAGLDRGVPVTAGQTVRIAFDTPATLRSADVTGVAPPILRHAAVSMTQESPSAWRVTLPNAVDPSGMALEFTADWAGGECHGDQLYAVGLGAPAEVGRVRIGHDGRARVRVLAHAAITVVTTLRGHRARSTLAAGERRSLVVPRQGRRLRLVITTADGGRTVVTRRLPRG